ncbi:MAG: hypothetical protein CMP95_10445 [Gammaproteobacteria bacterium]|nr:hypothetical protein [Gammaproteobacteria bacterium]
MRCFIFGFLTVFLASGCVSNKAIQTVQADDRDKSCATIRDELVSLGAVFEEVKDESGVTGKNVGLALVFWPGIIVNEVRANKNQDSIDARISHLTGIYNSKCSNNSSDIENTTDRLRELRKLSDEGLISEEEYESARKSIVDKL